MSKLFERLRHRQIASTVSAVTVAVIVLSVGAYAQTQTAIKDPEPTQADLRALATFLATPKTNADEKWSAELLKRYEAAYGNVSKPISGWSIAVRRTLVCTAIKNLDCMSKSLKILDATPGFNQAMVERMVEVTRHRMKSEVILAKLDTARQIVRFSLLESKPDNAAESVSPSTIGMTSILTAPKPGTGPMRKEATSAPSRWLDFMLGIGILFLVILFIVYRKVRERTQQLGNSLIATDELISPTYFKRGQAMMNKMMEIIKPTRPRQSSGWVATVENAELPSPEVRDEAQIHGSNFQPFDIIEHEGQRQDETYAAPNLSADKNSHRPDAQPTPVSQHASTTSMQPPQPLQPHGPIAAHASTTKTPGVLESDRVFQSSQELLDAIHEAHRDVDSFLEFVDLQNLGAEQIEDIQTIKDWQKAIAAVRQALYASFTERGWPTRWVKSVKPPRDISDALQKLLHHATYFSAMFFVQNHKDSEISRLSMYVPMATVALFWNTQKRAQVKLLRDGPSIDIPKLSGSGSSRESNDEPE